MVHVPARAVSMANLVDGDVGPGMKKITEYVDEDDSYDSLEEDLQDPNVMIISTQEVDESEDLPPDMRTNTISNPFLKLEPAKSLGRKKITKIIKHRSPSPTPPITKSPSLSLEKASVSPNRKSNPFKS